MGSLDKLFGRSQWMFVGLCAGALIESTNLDQKGEIK
jgi:hypothetical protein